MAVTKGSGSIDRQRLTKSERRGSDCGEADMIQRRIRAVKWLNTTPALGVCSVCSREFKVPMNALKRTADAQASLQEQFDRHKCQYLDSSEVVARQEPDEEDDEEEDDRKEDDEDDDEGDGYSE